MTASAEGVVKYDPRFEVRPLPLGVQGRIAELNYWRGVLYVNKLIGLGDDGIGYGNISVRVKPTDGLFAITSTQTGHLADLGPEHYAVVTGYDLTGNQLEAYGSFLGPSSEAMTHGALYEDPAIGAVAHAHNTAIWNRAEALGIPATSVDVEYGTPEMAQEMERLLREPRVKEGGILAMLGHKDCIITFGQNLDEAGQIMLEYLHQASPDHWP